MFFNQQVEYLITRMNVLASEKYMEPDKSSLKLKKKKHRWPRFLEKNSAARSTIWTLILE